MRRRGEMLERPFAHCLETGGLRRVFIRGRENIEKRYQIHVAGYNLGLLMRSLFGKGTPRGLQGCAAAFSWLCSLIESVVYARTARPAMTPIQTAQSQSAFRPRAFRLPNPSLATAC